ncbi:asparaginase domain-containing protein [Desulfoluna spongiiphila]|uniref:L-asparaginase n=1 Tax=Desulfoluna spongiiphila TaxID=419481 RepID=A0A1G5F6Q0_9BACT|nr:asparaginase domain-containing protein [Desulfoluna spongiiphila]SCY34929.1 L-asparaginase [Desulfoluna spongiiphila]
MKLYILYTGGTIGSVGTPLSPMSGADFKTAFTANVTPMITGQTSITEVDIAYFDQTLDSTNMQPSGWVMIAQAIFDNYKDYDAFLVLHGTDTMAWTSSALSFLLPGTTKPITVTGSQLPLFIQEGDDPAAYPFLFNTDALRNVLGSVQFLTMGVNEVCLYFADYLYRGNRVVKTNASEFVAFSSPNYPALGEFGILPTLYNQFLLPLPGSNSLEANYEQVGADLATITANITSKSVIQFLIFPAYYNEDTGGDPSLLTSMLTQLSQVSPPLAGIIFESYGEGNIPSYQTMQTLLGDMHSDGIILVDCTQVLAGDVNYNAYATGAWLKEAGVISGHDMTPIAGLAKLVVLLARDPSMAMADVENLMGQSLAGELTPYYAISGYQNAYLAPGENLFSINGNYQFQNTTDGTLALYDVTDASNPTLIWSQDMGAQGRLVMQSDNNLVFYDMSHTPLWATNTAAIGHNAYLQLGNDGSLALYNMDTDEVFYTIYAPSTEAAPMADAVPTAPEILLLSTLARRR